MLTCVNKLFLNGPVGYLRNVKNSQFKFIAWIILAAIFITVGIQGYWSYRNYLENRQLVLNELQNVLDDAVDSYYEAEARSTFVELRAEQPNDTSHVFGLSYRSRSGRGDSTTFQRNLRVSDSSVSRFIFISDDTLMEKNNFNFDSAEQRLLFPERLDSISPSRIQRLEMLTSKVMISLRADTLELAKLDSLVAANLELRNLSIDYDLQESPQQDALANTIYSSSSLLSNRQTVGLIYDGVMSQALKRSLTGILLSLLVAFTISGALLYLYRVIRNQKELNTMKNDLINNMTHEFKTPIATVLTALEGLQNFNAVADPTKSKKYIDLSREQLEKLNNMVEKLLETAMIDQNELVLRKEATNIHDLVQRIIDRYQIMYPEKSIRLAGEAEVVMNVDPIHFENAIGNLVDNACKYGGDQISIVVSQNKIKVEDNGGNLRSEHAQHVFDKFYRVPKGNVHDVKGFGIGLFYTKKIVERHGGALQLSTEKNKTTFTISFTHE